MSINFEIICRLCMAESKSMKSVFEKTLSLSEKITALMPVLKISEGDNLPTQVCDDCVNQVNRFHSFKLQCENSHSMLSKYLETQPQVKNEQVLVNCSPSDAVQVATLDLCKEEVDDGGKEVFPELEEEIAVEECKLEIPEIRSFSVKEEALEPEIQLSFSDKQCSIITKAKAVPCHICTKLVVRKRLNEHIKRHLGGRPFTCGECGKTFAVRNSLKKHSLVHSGLKAHMCDVCGKSFKFLNQLKTHHVTHTGQKSYVCDVCGKRFSQLGSFRTHEMLHTGEKPFNCDICGKGYSQKNSLLIHLAVHTGHRQHVCTVCGKGFLLKGNLRTHLVVHSGEKKFSCNVCGASYTQRHSLKKHARKHNNDQVTTKSTIIA